jgi:hypothetical protein
MGRDDGDLAASSKKRHEGSFSTMIRYRKIAGIDDRSNSEPITSCGHSLLQRVRGMALARWMPGRAIWKLRAVRSEAESSCRFLRRSHSAEKVRPGCSATATQTRRERCPDRRLGSNQLEAA